MSAITAVAAGAGRGNMRSTSSSVSSGGSTATPLSSTRISNAVAPLRNSSGNKNNLAVRSGGSISSAADSGTGSSGTSTAATAANVVSEETKAIFLEKVNDFYIPSYFFNRRKFFV